LKQYPVLSDIDPNSQVLHLDRNQLDNHFYQPYHGLLLAQRKETFRDVTARLWPIAVLAVLLLNVQLIVTAVTLIGQSTSATVPTPVTSVLFPYYLTPAGFAHLWGFLGIGQLPSGLAVDVGIIVGAILFALTVPAGLWLALRGQPVAFVYLVMTALMLYLFGIRADFGLFKIAMYIQPFLIGTLLVSWEELFTRLGRSTVSRVLWILPLVALIGFGMRAQFYYTIRSLGDAGSGLVEIPNASGAGLISQLSSHHDQRQGPFLSDTANVVLGKFESLYFGPIHFYAKDFLGQIAAVSSRKWNPAYQVLGARAKEIVSQRVAHFVSFEFDMHGAIPSTNEFTVWRDISDQTPFQVIASGNRTTIVNKRRRLTLDDSRLFTVALQSELKDYLVFVSSQFGLTYYLAGSARSDGYVSMYQPELDFFFRNETMVGQGRDSVFRILNPSSSCRMAIEYTGSLKGDRDNRIPAASAIGDRRVMFDSRGRGSARLFSPPIQPQHIAGGEYVALDMGTWGSLFPDHRSKIMSLYGRDVLQDSRRIVGFARDISVTSEEEYAALRAPRSIAHFPDDLKNKDLEYSGIYEDGWVAESSYALLEESVSPSTLVVSVSVPLLHGRPAASVVRIMLDGQEICHKFIAGGVTVIKAPVQGNGRHRIELLFDRADNLPGSDGRPVSAQLNYVGFQPISLGLTAEAGPSR